MQHKDLIIWGDDLLAKAVVLVILPQFMREKLTKKNLPAVNNLALKVFLSYR